MAGIIGNPRVMSFSNPPSNNIDEFPSGCEQGMTIFNTGNNFVGLPGSSYFGILVHYQRGVPSLVTESQQVYQIFFSQKRYVRRGGGNGTTVIFSDWSEW